MISLDLKKLESIGAFISPSLKKIPVEWEMAVNGKLEKYSYYFFYDREISIGSEERIGIAKSKEDGSYIPTIIAERVRLGEAGEQAITLEDAKKFNRSLAWAIVVAISNDTLKEAELLKSEDVTEKKKQSKKSGTS